MIFLVFIYLDEGFLKNLCYRLKVCAVNTMVFNDMELLQVAVCNSLGSDSSYMVCNIPVRSWEKVEIPAQGKHEKIVKFKSAMRYHRKTKHTIHLFDTRGKLIIISYS
jgi:hypothetical protein